MDDFARRLHEFAESRGLKLSCGGTVEETLNDLIQNTYTFCKLSSLYKLKNMIKFHLKDSPFRRSIINKIDTKMRQKAYYEMKHGKVEYHNNDNLDWSLILKRSELSSNPHMI